MKSRRNSDLRTSRRSSPRLSQERPSPSLLDRLLRRHGVELRRETVEKLWQYHRLLIESNSDGDLTRLRSFPTIVERHYADSILPSAYVSRWPSPMIDIGTGAGFPGIPLKIVHPEMDLTLCEPRPQRIAFLQKVIDRLELQGVEVFGHKVTSQSMRRPIRGAMSRAFELFPKTLLRLENSMEIGGRAYFFKGPAAVEELKEWKRSPMKGWEVVEEHWFTIPNSTQERSLIVVERVG